jgi:hypothetical protein
MRRLLFILLLFCSLTGISKSEKFIVIKQLDQLWMDYNEGIHSFVPLEQALFNNKKVSHLQLKNFKSSDFLVFHNISKTQLFIGNKLFKEYSENKQYVLSLNEILLFVGEKEFILTFFNVKGELPIEKIFIGEKRINSLEKKEKYQIFGREALSHVSIVLFLLFSGGVLAFVKNSKPTTYKAYFDLTMHFKNIEDHIIFNSFSKTAMLLPIIIAVLIGVSLNLYGFSFFAMKINLPFWLRLGLDTFIIMSFLFIKFFFLGILSWILSLRGLRRLHFFEFTRIAAQYAIFLFLFAVIHFSLGSSNDITLVILSFIFFLFLTIKLFTSLNRVHKFSNLFLFFYFCTAEVFPLFVLVKQLYI